MKINAKIINDTLTGALIAILAGLVVVALVVLTGAPANAEHSVGFAAGSTRGVGATYRYMPESVDTSPWGWQVTGLPFITSNEGTVSLGGALIYRLSTISGAKKKLIGGSALALELGLN